MMKSIFRTAACILCLCVASCDSQNFDKEFDCNGTTVKFNDYERFFEVGGTELSSKKDFFMNQITLFGKYGENNDNATIVSFNKINHNLELKNSSKIITTKCIELDKK